MSCGTCPNSAQPTTRQGGTAPTPGTLLWSADVGGWYRRQRAQGGQPAIVMPAPVAPAPAPVQTKVPQTGAPGQPTQPGAPDPPTAEEAGPVIQCLVAQLTGHNYQVYPYHAVNDVPGAVFIDWDTLEEGQQLAGVGIGTERRAHNRTSVMLMPSAWPETIRRLRATQAARTLLHDQRVAQEMAHSKRVLLCRASPDDGTVHVVLQKGHASPTADTLRIWQADAAGAVAIEDTIAYPFPAQAAGVIETMRANAQRDQLQHCFSCGAPLGDLQSCPQCGRHRDRWFRRL